jgi:hypothetical protein
MPPADFAELLKDQALAHASDQCEYLAKELDDDNESPDYWREDVESLIEHFQYSAAFEDASIPLDMKSTRPLAETYGLIQELIRRYSVLLGEWPAMIEAARELRDSGEPLFASPER